MNPHYIIAIETSGPHGSVALGDGDDIIAQETFSAVEGHGRELLPVVDRLCRSHRCGPADLAECYLSIGPGSFTGLRVGVAFARHLALARGVRLIAVPTLDVMAANALQIVPPPRHVVAMLDAKRDQVFGAVYALEAEGYRLLTGPLAIESGRLLAETPRPQAVLGAGARRHQIAIEQAGATILPEALWTPVAASVFYLARRRANQGNYADPHSLIPLYIRRPEAEELWEKRHAGTSSPEQTRP